MLQTKNLEHSYDQRQVLSFPDINCEGGQMLLLLGKSGVGKTTLLHLLGGLITPQKGQIILGDTSLHQLKNKALDHFRGQNIGIVFQSAHFVQSISVLENLLLAQSLANQKEDKSKCLHLLESLGIVYKAHEKTASLSQGEKQRLSIARALINRPKLILADEPTAALDDENTEQVIQMLKKHTQDIGAALVIVTHDARLKDVIPHQITLPS